ncbi:MAG TPA: SDR family oxidoreductase [Candidatus Avoscillospira avicola]|uniref:SDR family oxidoreductase n=1 Tax=Candidatus Avoscillospira avicola TaxID=2840706 RepID=A0A9D1DIV2_9FIRM|nr:SDR family oxidoreductase [Candidatus Avoscillospira avicola]
MNVLITGGSRGVGAAAVRRFCALGHRVRFFYVSSHEKAMALAAETGAEAVQCDVADPAAVAAGVEAFGPVDVLINNAAIAHYGLISQIREEMWQRLFAVNVHGVYHCVNAVLPGMLRQQRGCIINIASMWGQVGASCEVCYSATKGAVIALTKALAKELAPSGIRVNAIAPGVVLTDMVASVDPESMEALREETPLERHGTPEDIVQAMEYLTEASFVTGQVLAVNGGLVI